MKAKVISVIISALRAVAPKPEKRLQVIPGTKSQDIVWNSQSPRSLEEAEDGSYHLQRVRKRFSKNIFSLCQISI